MSEKPRFFSQRTYAAPFGRYEAGSAAEPPANEVLVGREGQRAYFIDQLLRRGKRGAYLVTGHRGVGKSNFVQYCLQEYEKEVFERFLQSNVGRVTFWDRLLVLGCVALLILMALIVSELAELISLAIQNDEWPRNILIWAILTPLIIVCLYPALFAGEVLEVVVKAIRSSIPEKFSPQWFFRLTLSFFGKVAFWLLAVIVACALLAVLWNWGPFGAPAVSASRLLCALAAITLTVQSTSYRSRDQAWRFGRWNWSVIVVVTLLVAYLFCLPSEALKLQKGAGVDPALLEYRGNLGLSAVLAGMGCFLQGLAFRRMKRGGEVRESVGVSYGRLGASLIFGGFLFLAYFGVTWAVITGCALVIVFGLAFWLRCRRETSAAGLRFVPQPLLILVFKALLAVTICLQLLHPVVAALPMEENRFKIALVSPVMSCPNPDMLALRDADSLWSVPGLGPGPEEAMLFDSESRLEGWSLFHGSREELFWLLCVFLTIALLFFLEYEWLVRPFLRQRIDSAIDPGHLASAGHARADRRLLRNLAEVTFPWLLFRAWLPVLVASVNLGFERLDHRRVVHSMLLSLRAKYHRAFLAWNSLVANLGRLFGVLVLLLLVAIVGNLWFSMPSAQKLDEGTLRSVGADNYREICKLFQGRQEGAGAVNLVCKLAWGDEIFHLLTYNLATAGISADYKAESDPLLFLFFPYLASGWPESTDESQSAVLPLLFTEGIHLRVYHLLLFGLFYLIGGFIVRRLPIFPYREALKKIDEVIDQLSSTTSVTSTTGLPQPTNWLRGFLVDERVRQIQQDPWDPRTVEFIFLHILDGLQNPAVILPGGRSQLLSLPTPDITFVFDELDKLGSRVDPGPEVATEGSAQQKEILHGERRRSAELHGLLADMKNLVSSAPARFIFVGGRNLHDEWLADQNARQPLLTNIFQTEVYLPSLLTDYSPQEEGVMHKNIEDYIRVQARRGKRLYALALRNELLPSPSLGVASYSAESFISPAVQLEAKVKKIVQDLFEATVGLRRTLGEIGEEKQQGRESSRTTMALCLQQVTDSASKLEEIQKKERMSPEPQKAIGKVVEWANILEGDAKRVQKGLSSLSSLEKTVIQRAVISTQEVDRRIEMLFLSIDELNILDAHSGEDLGPFAMELRSDFVRFLCYRSKGNPKRLKELLASFVRPVGRVVKKETVRQDHFACEHVLMLDDVARFRIQLLSRVYHDLTGVFEPIVLRQDDKLAMSVLYLADFLFKFHRRAFSWSNLERVDELAHIHRAPDLRHVLEKLVTAWTAQILHPIRNGMYDFRFLSEMSREIEYISRESQEEMAAFNFTLDESLILKSIYESMIQRLAEGKGKETQDLIAGLGELYEFDQEYETARFYYRKAISLLDEDLREMVGGGEIIEEQSPALDILGATPEGQRNARLYMTWGIARLRLMLQIGMTFELARNYERAEVEYRNAYTLARSLLVSMLDEKGRQRALDLKLVKGLPPASEERLQELKHLTLLFQPAFAEAWIGEKLAGGIDTSAALVEKELWELRQILPFVREQRPGASKSPIDIKHSNFALIISDLHNKAGDLYFIKGGQLRSLANIDETSKKGESGTRTGEEGYLLQAHYHYCVALHELRRFVSQRRTSSLEQLNIWTAFDRCETLSQGAWPAFVYSAAGEAFNDMAEAMIARVSFSGLLKRLSQHSAATGREDNDPVKATRELIDVCTKWIEKTVAPSGGSNEYLLPVEGYSISAGTVEGWLGTWRGEVSEHRQLSDHRLLYFDEKVKHDDETRLAMAISFMMVGAKFLERGGYLEDAARELLKVSEAVTYYLWWGLAAERLFGWTVAEAKEEDDPQLYKLRNLFKQNLAWNDVPCRAYWRYLIKLASYSLEKAGRLFCRSREADLASTPVYRVGSTIPPFALTLACSLKLAASHLAGPPAPEDIQVSNDLDKLLKSWTGESSSSPLVASDVLQKSLTRHSYPMVNRLHGLMVLIHDAVLAKEPPGDEDRSAEILAWAQELKKLNCRLGASMYFTPFSSGMSYGLAYVYIVRRKEATVPHEEMRRTAQKDLTASEEMITLRSTYYDNIAGLHYLYEDFNDRQLHFNHAIQIAGSEIASLLKYIVYRSKT